MIYAADRLLGDKKMRYLWMTILGVIATTSSPVCFAQDAEGPPEVRDMVLSEDLAEEAAEPAAQPAPAPAPDLPGTVEEVPETPVTPSSAPPAESDPLRQLKRIATGQFWLFLMRFGIAIALLGVAALLGRIGQGLTHRFLTRTRIVERFAELFSLDFLLNASDNREPLERTIARLVYYLSIAVAIVLALQVVGFDLAPFEEIIDKVQGTAWKGFTAIVWLLLAFAGGRTLQGITTRVFDGFNVDRRIRELSKAPPPSNTWAAQILDEDENFDHQHLFSENAGKVAFWLVMLLGLALAFEALEIGSIAEPLTDSMNRIIGMLPSLALGGVLIFGGYLLGRITSAVAHNLLHTAGFDGIITRLRIQSVFGTNQPSYIVGVALHIFVVLQAVIAALEELGLNTLSQPLTEMMARFWVLLPDLGVAALITLIGLTVGRLSRSVVVSTLETWSFNKRLAAFGFNKFKGNSVLEEPSEALGFVAQASVMLIAIAQAFDHLGLSVWSTYVNDLLDYGLTHVLVALVVVAIGYGLSNYVEEQLNRHAEARNDPNLWLGTLAKYTILVFAVTAAIRHLEIAEDFVLVAFGLMFGALCFAMALAFGLGSRDVAGEIVRRQYERASSMKLPPAPVSRAAPPAASGRAQRGASKVEAYGKQAPQAPSSSTPIRSDYRWESLSEAESDEVSPAPKSAPTRQPGAVAPKAALQSTSPAAPAKPPVSWPEPGKRPAQSQARRCSRLFQNAIGARSCRRRAVRRCFRRESSGLFLSRRRRRIWPRR